MIIRASIYGLFRAGALVLLAGFLIYGPPFSLGQTAPVAAANKPTTSLAESLQRAGDKHIFYVHGIGSDGPKDYDSASLRKAICEYVEHCKESEWERVEKRGYADRYAFQANETPPPLKYLGQTVWNTPEEWSAAAPYVVHWKLKRSGSTIYVHEINWWPLVMSLKCRQIVKSDAELVGPNSERIKFCSQFEHDDKEPGRFIYFDWILPNEASSLLSLAPKGALGNRRLKNGLLDWGLSDAILALGPLRIYILDGIRQLILKSVAMPIESGGEDPVALANNQEYVIVSHSLGSYLIFAALDINAATQKTPTVQANGEAFKQILARVSRVYFFANQLRLLELANLDGTSDNNDNNLFNHLEDWGRLRRDYLKSLPDSTGMCAAPQIFALNDPNDLLTWTVPQLPPIEVSNQVVKNATSWFGLIESPTKAHDNYARNKNAIGHMLKSEPCATDADAHTDASKGSSGYR